MKILNITEPNKFFSAVSECRGRVELVTGEGDRLNLKSTLCQYIALTQMFQDGQIEGVELPVQSVVTAAPRQCIQPDFGPGSFEKIHLSLRLLDIAYILLQTASFHLTI